MKELEQEIPKLKGEITKPNTNRARWIRILPRKVMGMTATLQNC